jgi:hypothetical protein
MKLAEAKDILRIPELWNVMNYPGAPAKSCRAPWREDRNASFSVSDDGKLWKDFTTGEGGDAVDFLCKAQGLDSKQACREFLRLAQKGVPASSALKLTNAKKFVLTPLLQKGSPHELETLSQSRGLTNEGLTLAQDAGTLFFSHLRGFPAWIITDETGRNKQARRLDGGKWQHIGDKKAWTLPGSEAAWPIAIAKSASYQTILLCEGGPDFLAAFHLIAATRRPNLFPVTMLGAGLRIHAEALPIFSGKRIRIFPHIDDNGQGYRAAATWQDQLESVGATVDAFSFDGLASGSGTAVKDLNDLARLQPNELSSLDLWEGL